MTTSIPEAGELPALLAEARSLLCDACSAHFAATDHEDVERAEAIQRRALSAVDRLAEIAQDRAARAVPETQAVVELNNGTWCIRLGELRLGQFFTGTMIGARCISAEYAAKAKAAQINAEIRGGVAAFGCHNEADQSRYPDGDKMYGRCGQWCGLEQCAVSFAAAPLPAQEALERDAGLLRAAYNACRHFYEFNETPEALAASEFGRSMDMLEEAVGRLRDNALQALVDDAQELGQYDAALQHTKVQR